MKDPCGNGNVLYLDYWCQYPGCDVIVLQDIAIGGNWVKGT